MENHIDLDLSKVVIYQSSIISQILDLIYWMRRFFFIFHCVTVQTNNIATSQLWFTFSTQCRIWVVFYWDQPFLVRWVGWVFSCSIGEKRVSVNLVDQLFQPASNQVEMVEKAFAWLYRVIVPHVRPIASSWKSVLLRNASRINPNRLQLKRLIPIEHDPGCQMWNGEFPTEVIPKIPVGRNRNRPFHLNPGFEFRPKCRNLWHNAMHPFCLATFPLPLPSWFS